MNYLFTSLPSRCSRLLWGLLIAAAGLLTTATTAEAQRIDCSELGVDVVRVNSEGDSCCAVLVLENGWGQSVTGVSFHSANRTHNIGIGAHPDGTTVSYDRNGGATITGQRGLPARTDDVVICLSPSPNAPALGTGVVVVSWLGSGGVVCTDTIEIECKKEEDGCVELTRQEIECDRESAAGAIGFNWFFTMKNVSDIYGRSYTIRSATQGVTIEPSRVQSNEVVAPGSTFPRSRHSISGARPGQTVVFIIEMCGSSSRDSRDVVCCTTRVEVKMPECEPVEEKCIEILEQIVECDDEGNSGAANAYTWCFTFRNTGDFPINQVSVGNSVVSVGPVAPGGTGRACVRLFGRPGPTAVGLLVCQVVREVDTTRGGILIDTTIRRQCCDMEVRLELPECRPNDGCIEFVEQKIECDSNGNYIWCFNVRNNANWNMGSVLLVAPPTNTNQGAQISPNPIQFQRPIPPGGLSERICVRISGARPGLLHLRAYNNASILDVLCGDSLTIELPECEPHERDCCDNFVINMQGTQPVAGSNGFTGILGLIQAGPLPITKASATIVSASVNGGPAFGYALAGTILNPLGNGTVTPGPFGQQIVWSNPNGVPMMNPSFTLNWLRFPPMAPNARTDTLRFCIRWQFTDVECRTCDTLVCYTVVRRRFFFQGRDNSGIDQKGTSAANAGGDFIGGMLTGDNKGTLEIYLPKGPAELGTVKYTGLTVQATNGATITGAVDADGSLVFNTESGLAQTDFDLPTGTDLTINLDYEGLDGAPSLGHFILLKYESSEMPGVEQQLPLTVTLRRDGKSGGDEVDAVSAEVEGSKVQTFAIHVRNKNGAGEALSGVRLKALSELEFLAVGPTSSKTEATLRFGVSSEDGHTYVSEAAEGTVTLPAGAERKPIYVTLAIGPESAPVIGFETLNEFGETVSEGEIDLRQITSVHDGGSAGSSISQLGSVIPNPATASAAITFSLLHGTDVSLLLRDVRGVEVARLVDGEKFEDGNHVVTFDVADLPNGTYFYTLETASGTETGRMVIQK